MSNFRRFLLVCAGVATLATSSTGLAQSRAAFQDLGQIDALIASALGAEAGAPGGAVAPIDRRLRLAACAEQVVVDPPVLGAVAVRCGASGWRIRVAVAAANGPARGVSVPQAREVVEPTVRRGDQIEAVVTGRGFAVSTSGVAEQDGGAGDRIRVRLDGRPRSVYGTVLTDGRIRL